MAETESGSPPTAVERSLDGETPVGKAAPAADSVASSDELTTSGMLVASESPDAAVPAIGGAPPVSFPDTKFGRFDRRYTMLTKWLSYAAGIALLTVVFVCVIDVLGWKLLGKPFPSAVDFIKYMNVALVFLAVSYVQTDRGSVAIEMGQDHFPLWLKVAVRMFGYFLGFAACLWVVYRGFFRLNKMFEAHETAQDVWKFPLWPFDVCLLVGMFFLSGGFVVTGIRDLVHLKNRTGRYAPSKRELRKKGITPPASS
jgi:TRAP-type mannitol/chloroaromatic compound transport system permease small subunit